MISLRPYQTKAVHAILGAQRGIVKAPAGSGKTVIAAAAIKSVFDEHGLCKTLWLANTIEQCDQATAACEAFGILEHVVIRCYAAGFACKEFPLVVLDECHHVPAAEFRKCLDGHKGIRWGFSATPERADNLKDDVFELVGPIVHEVPREELVDAKNLSPAKVFFHAPNAVGEMQEGIEFAAKEGAEQMRYALGSVMGKIKNGSVDQLGRLCGDFTAVVLFTEANGVETDDLVAALWAKVEEDEPKREQVRAWLRAAAEAELLSRARWHSCQDQGVFRNAPRNAGIVELVEQHASDSVLVLVGSIEHGKQLAEQIQGSLVLYSKMGAKKRKAGIDAFRDGSLKCAIATSLADEGLDVPRANVLILAAAGRSASKAEQRTGRVLRTWGDKTHGTIYDFWDWQHPLLLNQSKARARVYSGLNYEFCSGGNMDLLKEVLGGIGMGWHRDLGFFKKKRKTKSDLSTPNLTTTENKVTDSACEVADTSYLPAPPFPEMLAPHESKPFTLPQIAADLKATTERKHAPLSPSVLKNKCICPHYESDPHGDKTFAVRGSLGHKCVEESNTSLAGTDKALAEAAQRCISYRNSIISRQHVIYQEERYDYFYGQFGYPDLVAIKGTAAELFDWKFTVNVYLAEEFQFWCYAASIFQQHPQVDTIRVHVCHPFLDFIDIENWSRAEDFDRISGNVLANIARARAKDPTSFRISSLCQYCRLASSGECPKLASVGVALAGRYDPSLELPEGLIHGSDISDPAIIGALLKIAPIVETAAGGWKRRGMELWDEGTAVPGYEIVEKRGARSIASAKAAFDIIKAEIAPGITAEDWLGYCDIKATAVDDIVKAAAKRGDKGKAVERAQSLLIDNEILTSGGGSRYLKPVRKQI